MKTQTLPSQAERAPAHPPHSVTRDAIVAALRPTADTPEAFRASLARAGEMEKEVQAKADEARAAWMSVQVFGTAAEVAERKDAAEAYLAELAEIRYFREALEPALRLSIEREEQARLDVFRDRADASRRKSEAATEAFRSAWTSKYAAAAQTIADILKLEATALELHRIAERDRNNAETQGAGPLGYVPDPVTSVIGRMSPRASMGSLIRLPGVAGAPHVLIETKEVSVEVIEDFYDWDAPGHHHNERGVLGGTRPPKRQRTVNRTEVLRTPVTEDAPFWWPR